MEKLKSKVALVTGAAGGIGQATVGLFKAEGAVVVATDLRQPEADGGGADLALRHDVALEADWHEVIKQTLNRFGALDVLVNNAGLGVTGSIEDTSLEDWRRVMAVNLDGTFLGLKHAIPAMKTRGGAIVNVSSVAALVAAPQMAAYAASKGGVKALSRSAAIHCTGLGYPIRVNAVLPGFSDTGMLDGITGELSGALGEAARVKQKLAERQPMGRLGTPEEIARTVLFLACDDSAYMTGTEVVVDGGFAAR